MVHFKVNLFEGHLKFSRTILYWKTPFKPSEWGTGKTHGSYFIFKIYPWIRGTRNTGSEIEHQISEFVRQKILIKIFQGKQGGEPWLGHRPTLSALFKSRDTMRTPTTDLISLASSSPGSECSQVFCQTIGWIELVGERNKHSSFVCGRTKEGSLV